MKTRKDRNKQVNDHQCRDSAQPTIRDDSSKDFLMSAAIGYVTNSTIVGGIVGGDMVGGMVGDILSGGNLFD